MPNGSILDWLDGLRDLLADCPAWQAACGVKPTVSPKDRIKIGLQAVDAATAEIHGRQWPLHEILPCVFLEEGGHGYTRVDDGGGSAMLASGQIDAHFAIEASPNESPAEQERTFRKTVGEVLDWIAQNSGRSPSSDRIYVRFEDIVMRSRPSRIQRQEAETSDAGGDWFYAVWSFLYDANGGA